jgi:hypothetical protein
LLLESVRAKDSAWQSRIMKSLHMTLDAKEVIAIWWNHCNGRKRYEAVIRLPPDTSLNMRQ